MKRTWRMSGVVFLVMASLVSFACSGDEDESGPFSKFFSRYHKAAIGTVSKLDKDKKSMVVTNKKGIPVDLVWDDHTKVEGDLADGASVTVVYKMKSDGNIAKSVKVHPAAAAAPEASSSTSAPATATASTPSTATEKPAEKKK